MTTKTPENVVELVELLNKSNPYPEEYTKLLSDYDIGPCIIDPMNLHPIDLGGNKPKLVYKVADEYRLFKPVQALETERAFAARFASAFIRYVDLQYKKKTGYSNNSILNTPSVDVVYSQNYGVGSVQKLYMPYKTYTQASLLKLDISLSRWWVIDWVLGNHDAKADSFISFNSLLYGVDREQAFKFYKSDKLDPSFKPNNSYTIYKKFWANVSLYPEDQKKKIFAAIDEMVVLIQGAFDTFKPVLYNSFLGYQKAAEITMKGNNATFADLEARILSLKDTVEAAKVLLSTPLVSPIKPQKVKPAMPTVPSHSPAPFYGITSGMSEKEVQGLWHLVPLAKDIEAINTNFLSEKKLNQYGQKGLAYCILFPNTKAYFTVGSSLGKDHNISYHLLNLSDEQKKAYLQEFGLNPEWSKGLPPASPNEDAMITKATSLSNIDPALLSDTTTAAIITKLKNGGFSHYTLEAVVGKKGNINLFKKLKDEYGEEWKSHLTALYGGKVPATSTPKPASPPKPTVKEALPVQNTSAIIKALPDPNTLTVVTDPPHYLTLGAGKKTVLKDATGKLYLFKWATAKGTNTVEPFRAMAQYFSSVVGLAVKPYGVAIKPCVHNGMIGTIQPVLDLAEQATLGKTADPTKLTSKEITDILLEHVIDWTTSQHDSHGDNFMRSKYGNLIGIDKEQCFKYFKMGTGDVLSLDYHPNSVYGEVEPYYNKLWRAFAENKVVFDPKVMVYAFDALIAIEGYETLALDYIKKLVKDPLVQKQFAAAAITRRNTAKQTFEAFITSLYKLRTGSAGVFTFENGWVSENAPTPVKESKTPKEPKHITKKIKLIEAFNDDGNGKPTFENVRLYPYMDENGKTDPTYKTLKSGNINYLNAFVSKYGVTTKGGIIHGSNYKIQVILAADLEKEVEVTLPNPKWVDPAFQKQTNVSTETIKKYGKVSPETPEYQPAISYYFSPNSADLNLNNLKIGPIMYPIFTPSCEVENNTIRISRRKSVKGETYYLGFIKLRKDIALELGKYATFHVPDSTYDMVGVDYYDEANDCVKDGLGVEHSFAGCMLQKSDNAVYTNNEFSFSPGIIFKMDNKMAENLQEGLKKLLGENNYNKVFGTPNVEMCLYNWLLWSEHPKENSDSSWLSTQQAKERLLSFGWTENQLNSLCIGADRSLFSAILPGKWKLVTNDNKKTPSLWMFVQGSSQLKDVVNVLQSGLQPTVERVLTGISGTGASESADIGTGGAKCTLTRIYTAKAAHQSFHSSHGGVGSGAWYKFLIAPDEADRLDIHGLNGDCFGNTGGHGNGTSQFSSRKGFMSFVQSQDNSFHGSHEVMMRGSVNLSKILRVICASSEGRLQLLKSLEEKNITSVNGVPIKDYVVFRSGLTVEEVYTKYVKAAGY